MNEFVFNWSIENFSYYWHKNQRQITSPSFVADTLQNTAWSLELFYDFEFLSLYLIRGKDDGPGDFLFNCEFSCVTANNLTLTSDPSVSRAGELGISHRAFFRSHEIFVQREALFLPKHILTLRCRMWKREGDIDQFGQCFGRTRLDIERILSVADMNPRITRQKTILIHSEKKNKLLLSVKIFLKKDGLKLDIRRKNAAWVNFETFKFSAVGRNRTPLNYINSWRNMPVRVLWTMPFLNTENKASVTNKLKLTCEFIYSTGNETKPVEKVRTCSFKFPEFPSNCILSCIPSGILSDCPSIYKDLWDLYSKQNICDVELKTQSTSFRVHKTVLCARSPVFLAMFTGEMKEKTSKCVEIEDLENDTLEKFLVFLYTDNFEESQWNAVVELYYAADKYQVERLKFFCSSFFANNINVSNVCDLLILADRHSDSDLKSRVEYFILTHEDRIFGSPTWKQFSDKQPLLALSAMLCKYDKNRRDDIFGKRYMLSSYPNALEDFKSLYQSQALSDIIIQTTSTTFPAHKTILCAGSSTLRKLLASGESPVYLKMENLEVDTVTCLLLFLYTDSLGDINWTTATKLYHAAFAYEIDRLKIKCSCFFLENLNDSNAANLLKLAHEHRDVQFKSLVEDFVSLRCTNITVSELWAEHNKSDPAKRIETRLSKRLRLENKS